jgi:hypothetical protein
MYQTTYYVDKSTATPADTLVAHGVASLLMELAERVEVSLRASVQDAGGYYKVELSQPVSEEWLHSKMEPLPYLAAGKYSGSAPTDAKEIYPYEQEKERRATYFELRKQMRAAKATADDPEWAERLHMYTPDPGYDFFVKVNQMSAIIGYNALVEQWLANGAATRDQLELLLELFSTTPNPIEDIAEQWTKQAKAKGWTGKGLASASQVVNPGMGKGANRSKADVLTIGNQENFWLLEYLKFLGARQAMVPRVVSGSKDRKSYILEPRNITTRTAQRLFQEFQSAMWPSTHVKMDILAVLRWMEVFLRAQTEGVGGERVRRLRGKQPGDFVQGLWTVTYKDLGSAHAVMNVSLLRLPRWMRAVENENDAQHYLNIVVEHHRVVDSLDEKNSDAYELLREYRDFLSGADLRAFFRFCAGYGSHLLQRMERRQFAPQFTLPYLEELFMAHQDAEHIKLILNDPGFQNVATAIRLSTVVPQYRKTKGERLYEIRYGLGGRLLQKSRYPDELVQELTEFMFRYNEENGRVAEQRGKRFRSDLSREDVARVVTFIANHPPATVAGLLVAYGYARDPKEQSDEPAASATPEASGEDDS